MVLIPQGFSKSLSDLSEGSAVSNDVPQALDNYEKALTLHDVPLLEANHLLM